jgi:hypothetical protein
LFRVSDDGPSKRNGKRRGRRPKAFRERTRGSGLRRWLTPDDGAPTREWFRQRRRKAKRKRDTVCTCESLRLTAVGKRKKPQSREPRLLVDGYPYATPLLTEPSLRPGSNPKQHYGGSFSLGALPRGMRETASGKRPRLFGTRHDLYRPSLEVAARCARRLRSAADASLMNVRLGDPAPCRSALTENRSGLAIRHLSQAR